MVKRRVKVIAFQSFLHAHCLERQQPVKGKPLRAGNRVELTKSYAANSLSTSGRRSAMVTPICLFGFQMSLQIHAGMWHTNNIHSIIIDTVKNKMLAFR